MTRIPAALAACLLAAACACKNRSETGPGGGSGGGGGGAATCEEARAHVAALYAKATPEPPELAADNVAMVMADCAADPARVAPCAARAASVAELEARCLIPLDDEGSEGDRFRRRP